MLAENTSSPSTLSPQLQAIQAELEEARLRVRRLVGSLPPELWSVRPAPERWSIAEQIFHLNLTTIGYLPRIEEAIRRGREQGKTGKGPFRRDFKGWLLAKLVEPPVRFKVKTTAQFTPAAAVEPLEVTMREFDRLQDELVRILPEVEGLALDRIDFTSPFDPRIHYNLYSCLRVLPAHQRHHLWLGEKIHQELAGSPVRGKKS